MNTQNTPKSTCCAAILWFFLASSLLATPEIQVKGGSTLSRFSLSFGTPISESNISFHNIQQGESTPKARRGTIFGDRNNARDPLVRVGESVAHYFRIYNRGDEDLNITSVTFDNAQFSATDAEVTSLASIDGTSLAQSDRMTFFIRFTPTSSGPTSALCSITTNDPDDSVWTFSLFGDAIGVFSVAGGPLPASSKQNIARGEPTPSVAQGTDFETIEVGATPETGYFEITNGDNEPIDIASIGLADFTGGGTSGRSHFSISPSHIGASTIPGFGTRSFQVKYDPTSDGIHETYVGIVEVDAPTSFIFKLRGMTPQFPSSEVYAGSGGPFRPGTLVDDNNSPTSTDTLTEFGEVTVGGVASGPYQSSGERQHRFRMSNPGTAPLIIGTATSSSSEFQVTVPNPIVAEGDSEFFFIKFLPTNSGIKTAFITLPTNDPDNPSYRINVTGSAIGASLSVSGSQDIIGPYNAITSNQIPVVTNGSSFLQPHLLSDPPVLNHFKFTNNGDGPLEITGIAFQGAHPGDFFAPQGGSQYIGTIDAGATLFTRFGYAPVTDGVRVTQIAITTNDPDTPTFFLRLRGESTLGPIAALSGRRNETGSFGAIGNPGVTPVDNNGTLFDDVGVGNAAQNGFQLTNNGDALLKNLTFTSSLADFTFSGEPTDVAVGATADFAIKFNPTATGTRRAKITINAGPAGNTPYTFDVAADVPGPRFSLTTTAPSGGPVPIANNDFTPSETDNTDFGETYVDNTASSRFEIANLGDQPLNITSIVIVGGSTASHFNVSGISLPNVIDPNKTNTFDINLDPTNGGSKSGTIHISTNDPDISLFKFSVLGTAVTRPAIAVAGRPGSSGSFVTIAPDSITPTTANGTEFPATTPGTITTHEVRLTNSGDTALTIDKVVSDRAEIGVDNIPNGTTIAPGSTHVFEIGLKPSDTGSVSGRITIVNDDPLQPAYSFIVEGPGSKPTMEVYYTGGATDYFIANNFVYTDEPSGTSFGPLEPGQNQTHTFEFRNTGSEPLKIINEGGGGQFDLIGQIEDDGSVTILPGAVSPFSIRYSPSSVGIHSTSHLFSTDDPEIDGEEFTLNLTGVSTGEAELEVFGEGLLPTTAFREINTNFRPGIDTNATIFPETSLALGTSRRLKLVNTGNASLSITGIVSTNPAFSVDANTATIAPGAELITNLNFDPTAPRHYFGFINIENDIDADSSFRIFVSGIGSGKDMIVRGGDDLQEDIADGAVTSNATDGTLFPQLTPNLDTLTRTFEIVNYGTEPLTINSISFSGGVSSEFEIVSLYPNGLLGSADGIIPVAETATFLIKYEPTAAGARFTNVQIATDSVTDPIYEFRITGGNGVYIRELAFYLTNGAGRLIRHGDTPRVYNSTDLGVVAPSALRGTLIKVVNPRSTSVTVTDLIAGNSNFSFVKFPGELAPGTSSFFLVQFNGAPLPGIYETPITVLTTDPIVPAITFTVRATVGDTTVPDPDVTSYMADGDDIVFDLDAPLGVTFQVVTSTDLVTWIEVPGQTGLTSGTFRLIDVFGQPASDPRRFYRVDQE